MESNRVGYGRNPDLGTYRDDRYVRCRKCGFINNLDRALRANSQSRQENGVSLVSDITVDDTRVAVDSANFTTSSVILQNVHTDGYFIGGPAPSITKNSLGYTVSAGLIYMYGEGTQRETVTQGCAFCGCLTYDK